MFPDIDYFQLAPYRARDIDLFRVWESGLFDMRDGSKASSEVFRKRFRTIPEHSYMFPDIDYFQLAPYRARDMDLFGVGES